MTKAERELRQWMHALPTLRCKAAGRKFYSDVRAFKRAVIAEERERCAKYIETKGRGKCISDDSAKALAAAIREGK